MELLSIFHRLPGAMPTAFASACCFTPNPPASPPLTSIPPPDLTIDPRSTILHTLARSTRGREFAAGGVLSYFAPVVTGSRVPATGYSRSRSASQRPTAVTHRLRSRGPCPER